MIDWVIENVKYAGLGLFKPYWEFLFDGKSRFFWLYCLTGIAIALWVHVRRRESKPFGDVFFNRETWLGRSALNDYFVLFAGSVLQITLLSWAYVNAKPIAAWVASLLHSIGVRGTETDGTALGVALLLTVALFVVDDFMRYVIHLVMHRVPELWEYHKVHHSAEQLNFATAERFHPVETLLASAGVTVAVGLVNGVFIALFGDHLTPVTIFGANAFLVLFNIAGGVLRHAPVWVSFGPRVERWVISPAMHQIHHSDNPKHYDSNMGGSLSVWDRMFGTIYYAKDPAEVTGYGIGPETKDFRSLKTIYWRPLEQSVALLGKRLRQVGPPAAQPPKITPAE
jgi:sterol desaturase/sphingolipid hydroxylase (fatty acid hydroxylase superfamily)